MKQRLTLKRWKWTAVDCFGTLHQGVAEEETKEFVIVSLRRKSLYPVTIQHDITGTLKGFVYSSFTGTNMWTYAARKIATLLESGIPLLQVIEIMMTKESDMVMKNRWEKVHSDICAGGHLSDSIGRFQPAPGPFLEAMIKAGENSGTLQVCLMDAAEQLEEEHYFQQRIRTALFYPLMLFILALGIVFAVSIFILPMYQALFDDLDAQLSILTRVIFWIGSFIPSALVIMILILFAALWLQRTQRYSFSIPGTGSIRQSREIMQFCSVLGRLMQAGYPLVNALQLLNDITKGHEMKAMIRDLIFAVGEGRRISSVIHHHPYFTPEAAKMLVIAEESGRLPEMLDYLSRMFKREVRQKIERYARTAEPVLITVVAGIVGIVAVGVLMPIFEMGSHIQ